MGRHRDHPFRAQFHTDPALSHVSSAVQLDAEQARASTWSTSDSRFSQIAARIADPNYLRSRSARRGRNCARPTLPASQPSARLWPDAGRRRAQIAFSDSAAKQLENLTDEHQIHALDRALVAISVDPRSANRSPATPPTPNCASTQTRWNRSASCIRHRTAQCGGRRVHRGLSLPYYNDSAGQATVLGSNELQVYPQQRLTHHPSSGEAKGSGQVLAM